MHNGEQTSQELSRKTISQAEAHVEVIKTAVNDTVATKADLKLLEVKLGADIKAALSALEVRLIKWFVATMIAVGALIIVLG